MYIHDVSPEELAKLFHNYQEALASDFDCSANHDKLTSWEHTSQNERKLRIAAARLALLELAATSREQKSHQEYFAKPGEAEWGC
jgi:hypothetical protein